MDSDLAGVVTDLPGYAELANETGALPDALRRVLAAALESMQAEPAGWNAAIQPAIEPKHVKRVNNATVRITLPAVPAYDIDQSETITLVLPPELLTSDQPTPVFFGATGSVERLRLTPKRGTASLDGALATHASRDALRSAAMRTLRIALSVEERWKAGIGYDGPESTALLASLSSSQAEDTGWNALVLGLSGYPNPITQTALERIDDRTVDIHLPQFASYGITAPETLHITLPAEALVSGVPVAVDAPLVLPVNATYGQPSLSGSLVRYPALTEAVIQLESLEALIELTDDSWLPEIDATIAAALADSFESITGSARGWAFAVRPLLTTQAFTRISDTLLSVSLPGVQDFDLQDGVPEIVSVTVPAAAVTSDVTQLTYPFLRIAPVPCTAHLGGSLAKPELGLTSHSLPFALRTARGAQEATLRAGGSSLVIRLYGCTWRNGSAGIATADAKALLAGIVSDRGEPDGFNAVVVPHLTPTALHLLNASAVEVLLPALPHFDISAPEKVRVRLNASLLSYGARPENELDLVFELAAEPGNASVSVRSSRLAPLRDADSLDEAAVQSRDNSMLLRLLNDTWVPALGSDCDVGPESATRALLRALESAQSEPNGWNAVVRPALGCEHVARVSDVLVIVSLPPRDQYDITAPEVIEVIVPGAALTSGQKVHTAPPAVVQPSVPTAAVTSGVVALGTLSEQELGSPNATELIISLQGATWADAAEWANGTHARAVIDGLRCGGPELSGWDAVVAPRLEPEDLRLLDGISLAISLRQFATYELRSPELLRVTLPASVLRTADAAVVATPALTIGATPGTLVLNGTLLEQLDETAVRTRALALDATLLRDAWSDSPQRNLSLAAPQLRASFASAQSEPAGWNAVVQPSIGLELREAVTARYSLPAAPAYSIREPETLLLSAARTSLESARKVASALELVVMPAGGSAQLTDAGSLYLLDDKDEAQVRDKGLLRLKISLSGDAWARNVAVASQSSADLIGSFSSLQSSPRGWNAVVREMLSSPNPNPNPNPIPNLNPNPNPNRNPNQVREMLSAADLERVDDTTLIISVPQTAEYDITEPETIVAEIMGGALLSGVNALLTAAAPAGQLVIHALPGNAALDGSLLGAADVAAIQSPGTSTLRIQLNNAQFSDALADSPELQTALARGCTSLQTSEFGWNAIVRPSLSAANLQIVDQRTALITIPQFARYSVVLPEVIQMSVPASTLKCCGEALLATPSFIIQAPTPAALFGGSLLGNIGEEQLRSTANFTLSITLSGDEWSAAMDTDDALRAELLNSLVATASSEYGWNSVVRGYLGLETLFLDRADNAVTITLPAFPLYDTNAPETITCTVPSSAVVSGNRVFASPSFRIRTVSGGATLTGRLLQRTTEQDIRGAIAGSLTFELTVGNDTFTAMVGHRHIDPAATVTLLEGVRSAQSEAAGWNAVVQPALVQINVERLTPTRLTVTLPRVPTYDISVPETVRPPAQTHSCRGRALSLLSNPPPSPLLPPSPGR